MGKFAKLTTRLATASALAAVLGGCGYRELKAPCGPDEGKPAAASLAMSFAPVAPLPITGSPLDRLGGGIPVTDPCGPLQPLNGRRTLSIGSTADDPP
ncbi:MAG: hypothetical protein ACRCU1_06705 [Alsobacter sp.]